MLDSSDEGARNTGEPTVSRRESMSPVNLGRVDGAVRAVAIRFCVTFLMEAWTDASSLVASGLKREPLCSRSRDNSKIA